MGPKWCPNRIFDAEALRKPLGGILERSWRLLEPKKQSWNRSWPLLEASQDSFQQKKVQNGTRLYFMRPCFCGSKLGSKIEPLFYCVPKDFMAFQKHILRFPRALSAAKIITDGLQGLIFQLPVWNAVPPGLQVSKRVGRRCQAAWHFG